MNCISKCLAAFVLAGLALAGCSSEEPSIVCGREWNMAMQVVADTAMPFKMADPMAIQFRYGKGFDFTVLKVAFYEGSLGARGQEIWTHEAKVSDKMNSYTLQGKSKRGGMMTTRELTKQKAAGTVVVEFSADGRVLATREISIVIE